MALFHLESSTLSINDMSDGAVSESDGYDEVMSLLENIDGLSVRPVQNIFSLFYGSLPVVMY